MKEKHVLYEKLPLCHSVPFTCYEVAHTWTPSCPKASLMVARDSMKFSLKVYATFYGVSIFLILIFF